jgi:RimJ/RimL family protein N-acetyltransferase
MSTKKAGEEKSSNINLFSSMSFKGYGIELRPIRPWDLPSLRRWRNSQKISESMFNPDHITPSAQRSWYEQISNRTDQVHWVVWCNGTKTGYITIKNITGGNSLLNQPYLDGGFYVADSPVRHGLLGHAILMMYLDIIFFHMEAPLLRGVVLKSNRSVRALNKQLGCREVTDDGDSIKIELKVSEYLDAKKKFLRFFKDSHCVVID